MQTAGRHAGGVHSSFGVMLVSEQLGEREQIEVTPERATATG